MPLDHKVSAAFNNSIKVYELERIKADSSDLQVKIITTSAVEMLRQR